MSLETATTRRAIVSPDAEQYNAVLVRREDMTDTLATFWVRYEGEQIPFEPGQYITIGVVADGKIVQRPYSIASAPYQIEEDGYELFVRLVDGGKFTELLWELPVGHRMRALKPKGRFRLGPEEDKVHLFVCSGTGNAPFLSMMRQHLFDATSRRVVFLIGVSYEQDLGYRELLEGWEETGGYPVRFIPTVSRPSAPENSAWTGRTGRVETIIDPVLDELEVSASDAVAYLCGNPDMIVAAEELLGARGFLPEQIRTEQYWPKGRSQPT